MVTRSLGAGSLLVAARRVGMVAGEEEEEAYLKGVRGG
jgi:hypothetical protein